MPFPGCIKEGLDAGSGFEPEIISVEPAFIFKSGAPVESFAGANVQQVCQVCRGSVNANTQFYLSDSG